MKRCILCVVRADKVFDSGAKIHILYWETVRTEAPLYEQSGDSVSPEGAPCLEAEPGRHDVSLHV